MISEDTTPVLERSDYGFVYRQLQAARLSKFGGWSLPGKESLLSVYYNQSESSVYPLDRKWETFQMVVGLVFMCHLPQTSTQARFLFPPDFRK